MKIQILQPLVDKIKKQNPNIFKFITNTWWLSADYFFRLLLGLVVGAWVARYLGPANYGKLTYAATFVAFFSGITKLGLDGICVRNIIRYPDKTDDILGTSFILKIGSGVLTTLLSGLISYLLFPKDLLATLMVVIISTGTLFFSFDVIDFWFQSNLQSRNTVLSKGTAYIIVASLRILFILLKLPLIYFTLAILLENVVGALFLLLAYRISRRRVKQWTFSLNTARQLLADSWPLVISGTLGLIYLHVDQLLIKLFINDESLGIYSVAVRLSEIWYFIPSAIVTSIFPIIISAKEKDEADYQEKLQTLYDGVSWIAIIIAVVVTFLAAPLVNIIFGQEYQAASSILAIYIWTGPFVFLGVARSQWVLSENRTKIPIITSTMGAISGIILYLLLIPKIGGIGAAIGSVISYSVNTIIACFIYPPLYKTGLMLLKALFIPFRIKKNIQYFHKIKLLLTH
jgi:O-antigen/teichoic acid export membrane protein